MVDSAHANTLLSAGEEDVALGEEVLESAGDRGADRLPDPVVHRQLRGLGAGPQAAARIPHLVAVHLQVHGRAEIRQIPAGARREDGDRAGGVEAEEPDSRVPPLEMDVRADVHLVKVGDAGHRRRPPGGDVAHREGDDTDVRAALERVDGELGGEQRAQRIGRDLPVEEQERAPALEALRPPEGPLRGRDAIDHGRNVPGPGPRGTHHARDTHARDTHARGHAPRVDVAARG